MITEEKIKEIIEVVDLSKLKEPNSILVIRGGTNFDSATWEKLQKHIPGHPLIWCMEEGQSIEAYSEQEMNDVGWYRK